VRFLADMGVAVRVADWLRAQGHDAVHLREENLQTLPDAEVFKKAQSEDRILLAFDLDFSEIVALSGETSLAQKPRGCVYFDYVIAWSRPQERS